MANPAPARSCSDGRRAAPGPCRHWRAHFIETLAISSSVARAAEAAGVTPARAYHTRRTEPDFARAWREALAEGYLHLEMEVIRRLRDGDFMAGEGQKFDFASAIRLIAAQRDNGAPGRERDVSAAEVRASIDRKIEEIRRRVTRKTPAEGSAG